MSRVEVENVIDEMARSDSEAAEDARSLFEWLAGDGDENEITLSRLLRFAWYEPSSHPRTFHSPSLSCGW